MGAYALTTLDWWELTNESDEKDAALERRFLAAAENTVRVARRMAESGDPTGEAHLCLGGALGLISRWEAVQGKWFSAYRHGKQAFLAQRRAVELNPEMYDAYLGLGMFHYYTATLPATVKLLARLLIAKGDKERGLAEIRLAMDKGRFSRTAALLFLVGIYNNVEKDYAAALALVRRGRAEFPQSPFFHLVEMLTLQNAGDAAALRREAEDYLARIERGEPFYRPAYRLRGHMALGDALLLERRAKEAVRAYTDALDRFPTDDRWGTLTRLNRGKAYDLLGRRDLAVADYKAVLRRRDVWQLHDRAEELLDAPYAGPVVKK